MARTQKLWTQPQRESGRSSASVIFAAMLTAMLMAYVLLVFHPRLVQTVHTAWTNWGGKPAWALSTVAVGAIVGAASLGLMALAAVARGVQSAPYAWSAPVLIGACVLEAAQLRTPLPISEVSVAVFAVCSGMLMLVGGGLLQIRGWSYKVSGLLLMSLPILTIALGYLLAPAGARRTWNALDSSSHVFALVLLLMWVGTALLSLTTPAPPTAGNASTQLERLKERAWRDEIRLAQAQRRAEIAEHRLLKQASAERATAAAAPGAQAGSGAAFLSFCAVVLAVTLFAGYGLAYRPLVARVHDQREQLLTATRAHQLALQAALDQFGAQRAELEAGLSMRRASPSAPAPAAGIDPAKARRSGSGSRNTPGPASVRGGTPRRSPGPPE